MPWRARRPRGCAGDPGGFERSGRSRARVPALPSLVREDLSVSGETFQALAIPGGGDNGAVGRPMLPVFGRLLQIPDRSGVRVDASVQETDEYDGIRVIPVQDERDAPFAYDRAACAVDGYGDAPVVRVGEAALLHGLRVAPICFAPVRFNPAQGRLRVARRVRVAVSFPGENLENEGRQDPRPIPGSFDRIYRQLVINYDNGGRDVRPGSWLIICRDDPVLISALQPLVNWRHRKGLTAARATLTETGTTSSMIKAYLQQAYESWDPPLEYVVLAGDAGGNYGIPTWIYDGGEGDHPYTQLDGTDPLADIHIGRLSFAPTGFPATINGIVNKIVGYESSPFTASDPGWFTRACLVGDPTTYTGYSPVMVMQTIRPARAAGSSSASSGEGPLP